MNVLDYIAKYRTLSTNDLTVISIRFVLPQACFYFLLYSTITLSNVKRV